MAEDLGSSLFTMHSEPNSGYGKLTTPRAGASKDDELPLVVWLRGDEPYAGDFSMDAEATMALLGIKRSRLTQISGKELRVGRTRVDRYIRPVYRLEDVEAYLAWTRATASHAKSSSAIKEASGQLEKQAAALTERVDENLGRWNEGLSRAAASLSRRFFTAQTDGLRRLEQVFNAALRRLETTSEASRRRSENATNQCFETIQAELSQTWERNGQSLAQIFGDVAELIQRVSQIATAQQQLARRLEDVRESLEALRSNEARVASAKPRRKLRSRHPPAPVTPMGTPMPAHSTRRPVKRVNRGL